MVAAAPVRWWQVELEVPVAHADDVAALAIVAGADGAELDIHRDPARVTLSFAGERLADEVRAITMGALAELGLSGAELTQRERVDTDWSERWKEHFAPLKLGAHVWIVPSWRQEFVPPHDALCIGIDPGMAFGTGQHATTALCMEWLEAHLTSRDPSTTTVLDVGCGSGILSIACAKLGVARALGIDSDPVAVRVARENATANHVDIEIAARPLAEVTGPFDVVVANILAHILCELATDLVRQTVPGGWLVLSGVLEEQEATVRSAFAAACAAEGRPGYAPTGRSMRDRWLVLATRL